MLPPRGPETRRYCFALKATAPLLPAVNKTFDLAPNGSTTFSLPAPPLLSTYHVVLSCKGQFDGKSVEFGHVERDVTLAGSQPG